LRNIAHRALKPAILHRHTSTWGQRNSCNIVRSLRVRVPRIGILVDVGQEAVDEECIRCVARERARRVLAAVGVDVEVYAADFGFDVARDVEGDFGPYALGDFTGGLGAESLVRTGLLEGNDEVGELDCLEVGDCSEDEEEGKECEEAHCDSLRECVAEVRGGEMPTLYYTWERSWWCNWNEAVKVKANKLDSRPSSRGCVTWVTENQARVY
jgi:hypothetical protein